MEKEETETNIEISYNFKKSISRFKIIISSQWLKYPQYLKWENKTKNG